MASPAVLRKQIESRLPGALTVYKRAVAEVFPTGVAALDSQIGGIPRGALTQIYAPPYVSSGKTALLLSLMAQVTRHGQFCALVDSSDCFDPQSAEAASVDLARVLWVRCGARQRYEPRDRAGRSSPGKESVPASRIGLEPKRPKPGFETIEQAFKAADILVQNGGFALMAVDLGNIAEKVVRKVPLTTWFRFARVVERMPAALVFLMTSPAAQSCAGLTLRLEHAVPGFHTGNPSGLPEIQEWAAEAGRISHAQFLSQLRCEVEIRRATARKPVQPAIRPGFTATAEWA